MARVIFDTETTGILEGDRVIQVGGMLMDNNRHFKLYDELCNRAIVQSVPFEAMEVHGITDELLQEKGVDTYADTAFSKMIEEHNAPENYLIAHNIKFDLKMLEKEGFEPKYTLIDTLRVAKHLYKETPHRLQYLKYSLGLYKDLPTIEAAYGIKAEAHSAIGDVLVLSLFVDYLIKEGYSYEKLAELTRTPVFIYKFSFGKYKGEAIEDVAKKDIGYLRWMNLNIPDLDEDMLYTLKHYIG